MDQAIVRAGLVRAAGVLACLLVSMMVWGQAAPSGKLVPKKARILLSANEARTTQTTWTYRWAMDAEWQRKAEAKGMGLEMGLKSEYARDQDTETADRLRTSIRLVHNGYGKDTWDWRPVVVIQTDGDHSAEKLFTLAAVGYRLKLDAGYLEVTVGASKDLRTAKPWMGDTGIEASYEKMIGQKLKVRTGPRAGVATLGAVRLRDDRTRYSWDTSLDYKLDKTVGLGYRLSLNNTEKTKRSQMLGLSLSFK